MRPLPIGIDDFKKLRENNFCYVDKSLFIQELLDNRSEVSVFMRPRRFGKTLGLSMLKYYFEKEFDPDGNEIDNKKLFDGLIMRAAADGQMVTRRTSCYGESRSPHTHGFPV